MMMISLMIIVFLRIRGVSLFIVFLNLLGFLIYWGSLFIGFLNDDDDDDDDDFINDYCFFEDPRRFLGL